MTTARVFKRSLSVAFAFAALLGLASCGGGGHSAPVPPPPEPPASPPPLPTEPLRLGLINIGALDSVIHGVPLHFANEEQLENSGPTYRAALLAIRHVNDAGGVWGMPVEHSFGDVLPPGEPEAALAEELIEQGAHALVGSTSQGILAMSDLLVRTRTPLVAAFSDAPSVADLEDDGFIFRTSISALFQAYALARLAEEDGFSHVAVAYLDLAWAQESAQAFTEHFNGRVDSVSLHPEDDSFEDELHRLAASAAPALVLFTFRDLTHAVMDEVIKNNHFEEFLLFEGLRTLSLYQDYPEALEGAKGVASYGLHITEAEGHWEADYMNEFGVDEVPHAPYMRETYDAAPPPPRPAATQAMREVATPGVTTIAQVAALLAAPVAQCLKALVIRGEAGPIVIMLRGDHELNLVKAQRIPGAKHPLQFADAAEIRAATGANPGSIGPVGLNAPLVVDPEAAAAADFICGANRDGRHYQGVNWGRDLPLADSQIQDVRNVAPGDPAPNGQGELRFLKGIEAGHIFQLGRTYSEAMQARVLDRDGKPLTPIMGCYGMGVTRLAAAVIEQHHNDDGILWPEPLAPFDVHILALNYGKSPSVREAADDLAAQLQGAGSAVLLDDRDERPGVKFADADLIGLPRRIVVGARGLGEGRVECRIGHGAAVEALPPGEAAARLAAPAQEAGRGV